MTRWRVACDTCEVVFESGPGPDGAVAAWCEACQAQAADGATACAACGDPLTRGAPGFLSIYGLVQDLSAVIEAWNGAPDGLARLLPERPRWLTDLTPPDPITAPDAPTRSVLERLAAGAFTEVAAKLAPLGDAAESPALVWTARAIARERRHDPEGAEHDWSRVLAAGEDARARLARGALRARRRDWKGARVDLQQAGDRFEARWDRAALALAEPVDVAPGAMPSAEIIGAARAEAGVPSDYWSDHTVGRLLWSLVLERALAREGGPTAADEDALRTAAGEFEHATFWDRGLRLHGWVKLGMKAEATAEAESLIRPVLQSILELPAVRGPAAARTSYELERLRIAIGARDAHAAMFPVGVLRHLAGTWGAWGHHFPCARCTRGLLSVESVHEEGATPA